MKCNVKGLVFVGFAAAILSANAMAATGDEKIVTSKAFTEATYQAKTGANNNGKVLYMKSDTAGDIGYMTPSTTVTENDSNVVTSGAVYTAIAGQGLGSTYEVLSNKLDDTENKTIATNGDSTTLYPSAKAVKTYADSKVSSASTVGTSTTVAPNEKAVSDALALKQAASTAVKYAGSTVGSATQPVYVDANGNVTALTYTIQKSVPSDAVFTDTTYGNMTGATGEAAGASGLVPAPAAGDNTKFLNGAGEWATPENTTYNTLTAQEVTTGTDETGKLVTAKILRDELDAKQNANTAVKHTNNVAVGSGTQPVYIAQDGTATATSYALNMTVPAAPETDGANKVLAGNGTWKGVFTGANGTNAGTTGLVTAPGATDNTKFLKGDGTWAVPTDTTYTADSTTITLSNGQFSATTGNVASSNNGLVTGATVYNYISALPAVNVPASCTDAAPCALVATTSGAAWVAMSQPSAQ